MTGEIIDKLSLELSKPFSTESRIVFIVSKIRKLLESEKAEDGFPYLSFYCDLSLHCEITHTKKQPRKGILEEFIKEPLLTHQIGFHTGFSDELNAYLNAHGLPIITSGRLKNFVFQLGKVISDTPIKVEIEGVVYTIVFGPPRNKDESGLRTITPPYISE